MSFNSSLSQLFPLQFSVFIFTVFTTFATSISLIRNNYLFHPCHRGSAESSSIQIILNSRTFYISPAIWTLIMNPNKLEMFLLRCVNKALRSLFLLPIILLVFTLPPILFLPRYFKHRTSEIREINFLPSYLSILSTENLQTKCVTEHRIK